jgi:hypothetical protein
MRQKLAMFAGFLTLVVAGGVWLNAQQTPPAPSVLATANAYPEWLGVGASTQVTIAIPLPYTSIIPTSVNLLQISATGTANILGQFHDDGQNGDLAAKDGIYSLRMPFTSATSTQMVLEVSAAFQGTIKRVLSPQFMIQFYASGAPPLPPDPGSVGMATLNGVDSDHDGLRDDVQRYIALNYPASGRMRAALRQLAEAQLRLIGDSTTTPMAQLDAVDLAYGAQCLSASAGTNAQAALAAMEDQVLNTSQRAGAYYNGQSLSPGFHTTLFTNPAAACLIAPSSLPN